MKLWPRIAEMQAEAPRRLTPRRLGWLEAVSAPCVCGGVEDRVALGAERAVLFAPLWQARLVVRGPVWLSALVALAWRPRAADAASREVQAFLVREMWTPARFIRDGEAADDGRKHAFGAAWRIAATGARLGFGHPSRTARRSVWDAPVAEILAHAVCCAEINETAEFESRDEVDALVARAADGAREEGTGKREQGTGNREQGTGKREQGTGNRERGTGNGSTVQRSNGSTVQRSNGSTVQRFNGPTIQRSNDPTVQRSNGPTVKRSNGPTVQRSNGQTVKRLNGKNGENRRD